jgi:hypothetical protein
MDDANDVEKQLGPYADAITFFCSIAISGVCTPTR